MNPSRKRLALLSSLLTLCFTSGCRVEAVIQNAELKDWYLSRLVWAVILSAVLGGVVARLLCRLPIKAPLLDCINAARTRFGMWLLALVLLVTPLVLWLDAWYVQPFGEGNELGAMSVLSVAILNWRALGLMALAGLTFYFSVAVFTRYLYGRTCNCKYAFIPKLR